MRISDPLLSFLPRNSVPWHEAGAISGLAAIPVFFTFLPFVSCSVKVGKAFRVMIMFCERKAQRSLNSGNWTWSYGWLR